MRSEPPVSDSNETRFSQEFELAYRSNYLQSDIRQFRVFALFILAGLAIFIRSDYLANGYSRTFIALLGAKTLFMLATAALFAFLSFERRFRRYDLLAFVWTAAYSVLIFFVDGSRPAAYMGNYLSNLLSVIGFYLLIPNGLALQIAASVLFSLLAGINTSLRETALAPLEGYAVLVCFLLANLVGIVGSARIDRFRRKEYRAQEALNELALQRERLIRETNHRVKNNLVAVDALLSLQAAEAGSEAARRQLEESRARLQSIQLIHDTLSNTQTQLDIPMAAFLRNLAAALMHIYGAGAPGVTLRDELADFDVDPGIAASCGMIVTELITNAFKYAFPEGRAGSILLRSELDGCRCRIIVRDDGIGLPAGFDPETGSSLGLKIVSGYVSQLRGSLNVEPGPGARFLIDFPLKT